MLEPGIPGIEYSYDEELDAIVVRTHGKRSLDVTNAGFNAILGLMRKHDTSRTLLDVRDAEYDLPEQSRIEGFASIAPNAQGLQFAVIVTEAQREMGLILETLGAVRWNMVRQFTSEAEARAWLDDSNS